MFKQKKITKSSWWDNISHKSRIWKKIAMVFFVIICIAGVGYAGQFVLIKTQAALWYLSDNTIDIVSNTFWKPMIRDAHGNVNILLVWIGGENHDGWMLTDAIIIAAWNPELRSISMISIPRDTYVDIPEHNIRWRINQVFSTAYYRNDRNLKTAAEMLAREVEEMTGIDAPYYAVVDFNGFKTVIDTIGWIDIYVPERVYDTAYPNDANRWYTTFHIERGQQRIDGDTALKYARSRHSSSDFARSARQQIIIEATIKEILRKENIQNVSTIKKLYDEYTKMVTTNIGNQEIIGMIKYIFSLEHMFNFWLTSTCSHRWWQLMQTGCFLYTPNREWFGGASVLLTNGSTYNDLSFYDYTRNFGHFVAQNQEFLIEWARIKVLNAIDRSYAQQLRKGRDGHATQIAVKLKKYGFDIVDAGNAEEPQELTSVIIYGDEDYDTTISLFERFFSISDIERIVHNIEEEEEENENQENETMEILEQEEPLYDADLVIILWNEYLDTRPEQFNYNM